MSLKVQTPKVFLWRRNGYNSPVLLLNPLIPQWIRFLNKAREFDSILDATYFRSRSGLPTTNTHVFHFYFTSSGKGGYKATTG